MLFVEFKSEDDECYGEEKNVKLLQYNIIAKFDEMNIIIGYDSNNAITGIKVCINRFIWREFKDESNYDFICDVLKLMRKILRASINDDKIIDIDILYDKCTAIIIQGDEEDED